jgi:hypothetical protein
VWWQEGVCRDEVLVPARVAGLVAAERADGALDAPHSDLLREMAVDFLDNVVLLDDQLQRDDVARGVDALVGAGAADERRLLGVVGVGLRYGAGGHKGIEQIALDGLLLVVDLHALVSRARVAQHDGDLALRAALLCLDLFGGEGRGQGGALILALLLLLLVARLLVCIAASAV